MKKIFAVELIIALVALSIILPLAFSIPETVTAKNQAIDWNNSSRSILFNLKTGDNVSGSITFNGDDAGNWFTMYDPNGNPMVTSPTYYEYHPNRVIFSFRANVDGEYYASVGFNEPWTAYINYEYTINPITFLGIDRTVLIGTVISISVVLSLIVAFYNSKKSKLIRKKL